MPASYYSSTTLTYDSRTSYAWRISFFRGTGGPSGKVFSYDVRAVRGGQNQISGHLLITTPTQASSWNTGDSMAITWDTQSISGNVKISISRQGGKDGTFETIAESTENDGTYNWTVTGTASVNCVLKIEPIDDSSKGTIQGLFTIYNVPTLSTGSATSVTTNSATLNGTVNPNGSSTTYYFQYGRTTSYGSTTTSTSAGTGTSDVPVNASLTGLTSNTTYHFRIVATNSAGTTYGNDQTFVTSNSGTIIRIPSDYSTIQAGIDAASDGDTVLVADGTYTGEGNKDLDFKGKAITVQSQNGAKNCIIDCENSGRGFYFHSGEGFNSIVSGFTVTNGYTNEGGGIYCSSSSPTITNSIISGNTVYSSIIPISSSSGGGIYCYSSSPTIINCTISSNSAPGGGKTGGGGFGGGIFCYSLSPTIKNCTISNNTASRGGGIYCSSSSPTITNSIISGNVVHNPYTGCGGGIYCYSSSPTIINCTISNNISSGADEPHFGGGICSYSSSSPAVTNCILWNNTPDEIYGAAAATYSDIYGGYTGLGNINSDPLFVSSGVYELKSNSPCINSGTSSGAPSADIDGNPRPQGAGYDMGAYEFFLASSVPTAATASATNITLSSATLNGTLNPNGASAWYYFQYGTTISYGSTTTTTSAGSGTTAVPASANITKLASGKTYHFRLVGANSAGTNSGSDQTFVSSSSVPSVTTGSATSVTINSATLNGKVKPNGASTTYYFQYGTTTSYGSTTTVTEAGSGTSAVSANAGISGLELNNTYHFRLVATNSVGTTNGSDQTFTTNALAPSVNTASATSVSSNSATLNGTINPNGASTTYYFEYGITTAYGSTTIATSAGSGTSDVSVNANITGLSGAVTYHFRLVATNSIGTTSGSDQTFTSLPSAGPTVATGSATPITSNSVTLKGTVNPNGSSTEAYFEYGTTTSYGSTTPSEDIGSGTSSVTVNATISALLSETVYHYRLTATNIDGTSSGSDRTFYTAAIYVSSDGTCGGNAPCYFTIQEAIDAASSWTTIHISEGSYDEDVTLYEAKVIILQGGWDATFTTQTSYTTVKGTMTIGDGNIKLKNVKVHF